MTKVDTAALKKPIKKYKKWLESDQLDYPYRDNNKTYYLVSFSRFDKRTGCLILLANGEVAPRDAAIPIYKQYIVYHTCMVDAGQQLVHDKNNPVEVFEVTRDLLTHVMTPVAVERAAEMVAHINNVLAMADTMIKGRERLQIIFEQLRRIDQNVRESRGYLTSKAVEMVKDLTTEWRVIQYDGLRKSRDAVTSFKRLRQFSQSWRDHINEYRKGGADQVGRLMADFSDEDNVKTLHRSLQRMEVDAKGSPVTFSVGEQGLREYAEHTAGKTDDMFQLHVLPILRNA